METSLSEKSEMTPEAKGAAIRAPVGVYGWRKRCLYGLILMLLVTVIMNIALTIWIIKVMDFSVHGMGKLRVTDNGLRLEGNVQFLKNLFTTKVLARKTSGLEINSQKNITLFSSSSNNTLQSSFVIGNKKVQSYAEKFQLFNSNGKAIFSADDQSVEIGAKSLSVTGNGGTILTGSLQTDQLRSFSRSDLRIESPSKSILFEAAERVNLRASTGSILFDSHQDITLRSSGESITLDARNITMRGLPLSDGSSEGLAFPLVYQICVCGNNGKLFLSQAEGTCQATQEICS